MMLVRVEPESKRIVERVLFGSPRRRVTDTDDDVESRIEEVEPVKPQEEEVARAKSPTQSTRETTAGTQRVLFMDKSHQTQKETTGSVDASTSPLKEDISTSPLRENASTSPLKDVYYSDIILGINEFPRLDKSPVRGRSAGRRVPDLISWSPEPERVRERQSMSPKARVDKSKARGDERRVREERRSVSPKSHVGDLLGMHKSPVRANKAQERRSMSPKARVDDLLGIRKSPVRINSFATSSKSPLKLNVLEERPVKVKDDMEELFDIRWLEKKRVNQARIWKDGRVFDQEKKRVSPPRRVVGGTSGIDYKTTRDDLDRLMRIYKTDN